MLKIVRTPAAVRDLAVITDYIAADNLTAALGLYDEIDRLLAMIAQYGRDRRSRGPSFGRASTFHAWQLSAVLSPYRR
jgi:plasmid stabilization system protein ParE